MKQYGDVVDPDNVKHDVAQEAKFLKEDKKCYFFCMLRNEAVLKLLF